VCNFVLSLRNGISIPVLCKKAPKVRFVSGNRYHARQAAAALLKMARATSDPEVAAGLVRVAADLKEQAGELPPAISAKSPDLQKDE
jgi:hypothetical protein